MNRTRLTVRLLCGAAALLAVAGCATTEVVTDTRENMRKVEALNEVATRPMAPANVSPVKVSNDVYVGADVYRNDHGDPLPAKWARERVTFVKSQVVSFQEVANMVSVVTRIPVATSSGNASVAGAVGPVAGLTSSAIPVIASNAQSAAATGAGGPGLASGPLPPGFDVSAATNALLAGRQQQAPALSLPDASANDIGIPGSMRVSYSGSLRGFLDLVGTNFNVGWEYSDGRILFQKRIVRNFEIPTLPVLSKMDFKMTSGSDTQGGTGTQSAGGSGSSGQNATTETAYNPIAEIKEGLAAVVSDGTFQYSTTTGKVTVIAPPQTMKRVASYIRDINSSLSKQIAMNVKVYTVTLSDSDNYGTNINLLLQNAGKYGIAYGTGGSIPLATGVAGAATNVANSTGPGNVGWAIVNGPAAGSNGIVQALSTRGDVSVVTSASVVTVNGVPVPLQVANTRGYAAQVSVTQTGGITGGGVAVPSTSITPGSVTTGFNLHLLPRVRSDGQLLLQYGMNISELVGAQNGFDVFSSNGSSIQLPNVNQRNFIQEAILPNASTLVLTGFEQVRADGQRAGPLSPSLFAFGGSSVQNMKREVMVITITPTLLDASVAANPPGVR